MRAIQLLLFVFLGIMSALKAMADGMVVDKVYHPYVLPYEREVEWRLASHNTNEGNLLRQRLGIGHSLTEYVSFEGYLIGERDEQGDFGLRSYEIEARWMLTTPGKYWADLGLLFEVERQSDKNNWEASGAVLAEKEFGRYSLTMNSFTAFEWGEDIESEWESELRLQWRYRWIPLLQPAIEVYSGEDFVGIGPGAIGILRFDGQKQLKWEAGYISEVAHAGKDNTFRIALEFEY
ncbi:MAG: hypothetical protein WBN40_09115 [Pseudomonadales bacterium]